MRRTTIALLAGLEASVAALIGLGIVLVPLMLLWAVHFGLAVDVAVLLRAAADVWLLGHGVDLVLQLDAVTAARIGLPGAGDPFPITIALLGFALISVAFGRRIGVRSVAGGHALTGGVAAVVVYAARRRRPRARRPHRRRESVALAGGRAARLRHGPRRRHRSGRPVRCGEAGEADASSGLLRRLLARLPGSLVDGTRVAVRIGAARRLRRARRRPRSPSPRSSPPTTRRSPASGNRSARASTAASPSPSPSSRSCRTSSSGRRRGCSAPGSRSAPAAPSHRAARCSDPCRASRSSARCPPARRCSARCG